MTNKEAVIWLTHILADIGKAEHRDLWHYEQALSEIKEMLEMSHPEPQWRPCSKPPEEDGVYIVYAPTYSGGSSSAKECHNGVMFSKYKNGKWSIEHGYYSRPNCVKAWKPLDKPWRGEEDG